MITQTFEYTGATQSFVVPAGVTRLTVELWGAQGQQTGADAAARGRGGYVKADINVTSGTTYTIYVGQVGNISISADAYGGAIGKRGGASYDPAGPGNIGGDGMQGGGSSEFRQGSTRILVAGGGGGGGASKGLSPMTANPVVPVFTSYGGHGGGTTGQAGEPGNGGTTTSTYNGATMYYAGGSGGGGGTQAAGGSGGSGGDSSGEAGAGAAGAAGTSSSGGTGGAGGTWGLGAGGGGGGYFSGGGGGGGEGDGIIYDTVNAIYNYVQGGGGGGGGGSSYVGHTSVITGTITNTQGVRQGNGRVIVAYTEPAPSVPTNITPAAGAVLNVADPSLGAQFTVSAMQAMAKVEWTLATDAGFTQNARTYTQPDSALQRSAVSSASYKIGSQASDQPLSQGTWYIRARTIDQNGTTSGYSGVQSFRIEYPPTTLNHFPTGNIAVAYVTAGLTFAWDFISPSPYTDQIAYQVVVETNAGVQIADTGRIDSTDAQATIVIPVARKGEQLRWRVRVWDSDNVQGPYSSYQLFRTVDGPQVTVDTMTIVNTANPTVSFSTIPAVNTTLVQKRLFITRDSDGAIVYDSGWR